MSLVALQRRFYADLRAGVAESDDGLTERSRLGRHVYRNAYRVRLRDCLRETYEKSWSWLGDARFDAAATVHIDRCTSSSWTLGDYGEGFAHSIATANPDAPEAVDLARLEWAMRRAFDGPEAPPLRPETCAAVDWETSVLRLVPTVQLIPARTNAAAIWSALSDGRTPPCAEFLATSASFCVWRKGLQPRFRTVDGLELFLLKFALAGARFSEMCRMAGGYAGTVSPVEEVGALFARWMQDEMIADPLAAVDQLSVICNRRAEAAELVNANQAKSTIEGE